MFSGSGNKTRLLRKQLDVWSCELEISSVNRKLLGAIFDSLQVKLIHTLGGLRSRLKPDPENKGYSR